MAQSSSHPGTDDAPLLRAWDEAAEDPDADIEHFDAFVGCLQRTVTRR